MPVKKPVLDPMISSPDSNEYFNAISHLIGAILSVSVLAVLMTFAALQHKWLHLISFSIYGTSLLLSFIASTLLHFCARTGVRIAQQSADFRQTSAEARGGMTCFLRDMTPGRISRPSIKERPKAREASSSPSVLAVSKTLLSSRISVRSIKAV